MIIKNAAQDEGEEIEFDPSTSRLTSTNVQGAIEEIVNFSGWNLQQGTIYVDGNKSGAPQWSEIGNTSFYAYKMNLNKEGWGSFTIPHDYKPGGDIYISTHFTTDGTDTSPIKWQIDYSISRYDNQATGTNLFPANQIFQEQTPDGTAYKNITAKTTTSVDLTKAQPSAIMNFKITRVTVAPVTDNTDDVFGLAISMHYETDRNYTANRNPPFD